MENYQFTKEGRNKGKKETMDIQSNLKAINKMALVSPYISIITINVNGLNLQTKSQSGHMDLENKNKKQDLIYAAYKRLTSAVKAHTGSK